MRKHWISILVIWAVMADRYIFKSNTQIDDLIQNVLFGMAIMIYMLEKIYLEIKAR